MIFFVKLTLYKVEKVNMLNFVWFKHLTLFIYYYFFFLDNKCTALPPVCHVNAFCNDAYGSYRFTCNSGSSGNGENCTGANAYVIE